MCTYAGNNLAVNKQIYFSLLQEETNCAKCYIVVHLLFNNAAVGSMQETDTVTQEGICNGECVHVCAHLALTLSFFIAVWCESVQARVR